MLLESPDSIPTFESLLNQVIRYGPVAASALVFWFFEPRARSLFKPDSEIPRFLSVPVYGMNWLCILGLLLVGQWIFVDGEAVIKGEIQLGSTAQTITSTQASFFLKRQYITGIQGYEFRIITPSKLKDGTVVDLYLDPGTGKPATTYQLAVKSAYYDRSASLKLIYHPGEKTNLFEDNPGSFTLVTPGRTEVLKPAVVMLAPAPANVPAWERLFQLPVVRAQQTPAQTGAYQALTSNDPIIRAQAQRAIASGGVSSLPLIEARLAEPNLPYAAQLGSLVALNGMVGVDLSRLGASTYRVLTLLANSGDSDLMAESAKLLAKHPELQHNVPVVLISGIWTLRREQSRGDIPFEENRKIWVDQEFVWVQVKTIKSRGESPVQLPPQKFRCLGAGLGLRDGLAACSAASTFETAAMPWFYKTEFSDDRRTMTVSKFYSQMRVQPVSVLVFSKP